MSTVKNFKELRIWQQGISMVKNIYQITLDLPKEEKYGLVQQIRRAAVSVPSNIAEGQVRGTREFIHFLRISIGSLAELETQLLLASELRFLNKEQTSPILEDLESLSRQIRTLIQRLENPQTPLTTNH